MVVRQLAQFDSALILVYIERIPVAACTTDINLLQDRVLNSDARFDDARLPLDRHDAVLAKVVTNGFRSDVANSARGAGNCTGIGAFVSKRRSNECGGRVAVELFQILFRCFDAGANCSDRSSQFMCL